MNRHFDNFEGAFPLLLIGSVLLVYAGVLASQQAGSHSSHLPLWGLFGGVGAVIVGAGIYSTFLEPELRPAPKSTDQWKPRPSADWEKRTASRNAPERSPAPSEAVPIWWEGPPARGATGSPASATPRPTLVPRTGASSPKGPAPGEGRPASPVRLASRPSGRYSFKELSDELTELEALVYGTSGAPLRTKGRPAPSGGVTASTCTDCDRPLTTAASATPCRGCGRGLCAPCATLSRSEDGEVRCTDCRARAA